MSPRSVIIIPCYNEALRLDVARFQTFSRSQSDCTFLLVNDGSHDGTIEILYELRDSNPARFDVLDLLKNCGKAEATRQGILQAIAAGAKYVGFWDADLATPLEPIGDFCRLLESRPEIDVVVGTRLPLLGHSIERTRLRRLLGRTFATAASTLLRLPIYDTQCGAKLFRVTSEMQAVFAEPFQSRWIFDVEILARMIRYRTIHKKDSAAESIYEFPLESWRDVAGSKLKSSDFLVAFRELISIFWQYLGPAAKWQPQSVTLPLPVESPDLVGSTDSGTKRSAA